MSRVRVAKKRLDVLVVERGLASSRQRARALIMAGQILVNNQPVDKAGTFVSIDDQVSSRAPDLAYVSRGGLKLEHALKHFNIDVIGFSCLDAGASTGGFTDCLLQHGAGHVYAVDVGYGQLSWKLRQDPRVTVIERFNIRYADSGDLPAGLDMAVIDVSFISLKIVVPAVLKFIRKGGVILPLIKPQFEVGKGEVGKGGVVRDSALHRRVIDQLTDFFAQCGLTPGPVTPSPILGPSGNKEFIQHLLV
jgi:23S rRNA (cytidine1920-2'-O)/16S rRNA (cytidine1409-2'-O)-methyltransferase